MICSLKLSGIVIFTSAAELSLRTVPNVQPGEDGVKLLEIGRAERRTASGNALEFIRWLDICQARGNRTQRALGGEVDNAILAPIQTPAHQCKLMPCQRMEWMCDPDRPAGRAHTTCN